MQLVINPDRKDWNGLLRRPYYDNSAVLQSVQNILNEVKQNGNSALKQFSKQFDGIELDNFIVGEEEINTAAAELSLDLKSAIQQARRNIVTFHQAQLKDEEVIETMPGVQCWRKSIGIEKVGLYIPGGTAPLFSTVLMLAVPAQIAGCKEIILCTPVNKEGKIHPAILYAAKESAWWQTRQ